MGPSISNVKDEFITPIATDPPFRYRSVSSVQIGVKPLAVREPNVSGGAAQAFTMVVATLPMTKSIKIVAVDDSLGIILPDEILRLLDVKIGDELQITDTPNGILLSSDSTEAMESARKVMSENREVLRRLAE